MKLSNLPPKILRVESPAEETSFSTPSTSPTIPSGRHLDGLELWRSLDVNEQAKLFRHQLRCAKDAQTLIFEWEEYCADARRKERPGENIPSEKGQSVEPQMRRTDHKVTSEASEQCRLESQVMTPFVTPPPAAKENDLKAKLESRLREAALKRQRAKELAKANEEGTAAKKIKVKRA